MVVYRRRVPCFIIKTKNCARARNCLVVRSEVRVCMVVYGGVWCNKQQQQQQVYSKSRTFILSAHMHQPTVVFQFLFAAFEQQNV
jgi:hypothetical protein